jgi:hypothetical protein
MGRLRFWLIGFLTVFILAVGLLAMNLTTVAGTGEVVPTSLSQGIVGQVTQLKGNQMPGISPNQTKPQGGSSVVWVFKGKVPYQGTRWPISEARLHPQWVGAVVSDVQGHFQVGLPLGDYTVFAQDGSDLYLNAFTGDKFYQSVRVVEGDLTKVSLVNSTKAVF